MARDIILSKIFTGLDFNKHKVFRSDIFNPVLILAADIYSLPRFHFYFPVITGKEGITIHDEPVFRPPIMALEAQPIARIHGYALHLVAIRIDQILEKSPGPMGIVIIQMSYSR